MGAIITILALLALVACFFGLFGIMVVASGSILKPFLFFVFVLLLLRWTKV